MVKTNILVIATLLLLSTSCNRFFGVSGSKKLEQNKLSQNSGLYQVNQSGHKYFMVKDSSHYYYADTIPDISFNDVVKVKKAYSKYNHQPTLTLRFNDTATIKLRELTRKNIGNPLLIIFNKEVISAPVVQMEIAKGSIQITGLNEKLTDEIFEQLK